MARGRSSDYVGLAGAGFDVEFTVQKETERAYLLLSDEGREFWMPKSAFDEDGALLLWAVPMLEEKLEKEEKGGVSQ